jgi:hypothetical protein
MKLSKKQIQKAQAREMRQRDGHYANNLETEAERLLWERQEAAMERIKNNPDLLRVMLRLKDR